MKQKEDERGRSGWTSFNTLCLHCKLRLTVDQPKLPILVHKMATEPLL